MDPITHFLVLFMSHIILLQLIFTFIYSIFNKKFSISVKLSIVLLSCRESQHSMLNSSLRGLILSKHENPFILHKKKCWVSNLNVIFYYSIFACKNLFWRVRICFGIGEKKKKSFGDLICFLGLASCYHSTVTIGISQNGHSIYLYVNLHLLSKRIKRCRFR